MTPRTRPGTRGLQALAERVLSTRIGAPLGALTYEGVARVASGLIARVPGVRAVYVTGSFARRGRGFRPGYSDLDLVVVMESLELDHELEARDRLDRLVRALRSATRIVQTVDVIEVGDLPILARFGDAWAYELTRRWRLLAGSPVELAIPVRDPDELALLELTAALRGWFKRSSRLLAIAPADVCERDARAAERLAADCLRVGSDELETAADRAPDPSHPGAGLADRRDRALAAALTALDLLTARMTRDFRSEVVTTLGAYEAPRGSAVLRVCDAATRAGFEAVATCARDAASTDHAMLVVAPAGTSVVEVLSRASRVLRDAPALEEGGLRWAPRPVFLTPNLWRAAFLFDPAPFAYESLSHDGAWLAGRAALVAPSESVRELVVRSTRAMHLSRARSRRFHARSAGEALARLAIETHALVGPLNARTAEGVVRFGLDMPEGPTSERELLARLRAQLDVVRSELTR